MNNPSTAPIEDLTADHEAKVQTNRDAAVLAIKEMNPSPGSESVAETAVDLAADQAKDKMIDAVVENSQQQGSQSQTQTQTEQNVQPPSTIMELATASKKTNDIKPVPCHAGTR